MERLFLLLGSAFGFLAVIAGSWAAHGLEKFVDEAKLIANFKTGAEYQMYHALALLAVAYVAGRHPSKLVMLAGWSFVIGIILFSGSLYIYALTAVKAWGAVTPFGGLGFLVGWLLLAIAAFRMKSDQ